MCVCYEMADIASASMTQAPTNLSDEQELNEFREIVWGPNIRLDVFQRWSQGWFLSFSTTIVCICKYLPFQT